MSDNTLLKNRIFDRDTWDSDLAEDKPVTFAANTYLHTYNTVLFLLSLCLIGYGGYLVNKHNSDFAKIFIGLSCFCALVSLCGLVLPYIIKPRIAGYIWAGCCTILTVGLILTFIFTFTDRFIEKSYELDKGAYMFRKDAAKWMDDHQKVLSILTGLSMAFSVLALGSWAGLELQQWLSPDTVKNIRNNFNRGVDNINNNINNNAARRGVRDLEMNNQPIYS